MYRIRTLAAVALLALLVAGCGGDDDDSSASDKTPSTASPTTIAAVACFTHEQTLRSAVTTLRGMAPDAPVTEAELVRRGLLQAEEPGYDLNGEGEIVPAAGSGCVDNPALADPIGQAGAAACTTERATLETAILALQATDPGAELTEDALVTGDLLKEASTLFDLDATGAVVPAPGSPC